MAEHKKQQMGDGSDNFANAASNVGKAVRQAGQKAASAGAGAAASGSLKAGSAAANIAKGTAAGGPWGAILAAAWSMRHTLYKILICVCLSIVFLVVLIVSLPSIVTDRLLGLDGAQPVEGATLTDIYGDLAKAVSDVVAEGYDLSLAEVERIIEDGGYDYELSMDALVSYAQSSAGFDTCYILAAYSASMEQQNTSQEDMMAKLRSVAGSMFPVTYEENSQENMVPVTYYSYKPITVTEVISWEISGYVNGKPYYSYETEEKTYYERDEELTSEEAVTVPAYREVFVHVPIWEYGKIVGYRSESYYEVNGTETLSPSTELIRYVECTIHPFDSSVITKAFGIDTSAPYNQFNVTYGEAIQKMAKALKMTLYGSLGSGDMVPLDDTKLLSFVHAQECNATRQYILTTALSLVGKVPYFWGGKSAPGWNDAWNTPRLVTAAGSSSTGTIRPYGLDCSGFTEWVYNTAVGVEIGAGTAHQFPNTVGIQASELLPGDLGFLADGNGWGHVLMFAGYDDDGSRLWVHCTSGSGVVLNTPSYDASIVPRRLTIVDYDTPVEGSAWGEPLYEIEVTVTHYCACAKCCGANADGITASGKTAQRGMVAMSSYYPFGTQILINGVMYTVEDRGGSGIENDIHRVDIFIPDHQEALRLGRFTTTAYIYRLGR